MEEKKATIKILLILVIITMIIIIPFIIIHNKNYKDENFPEHENIDITKGKLKNEEEYEIIRKQLENDYYFRKMTIMMDYDYKYYMTEDLEDMVWHFIFNYNYNNTDYYTHIDNKNSIRCLSKKFFINAFKELYNIDIEPDLYLLKGYYKYIYEKAYGYCLDFGNVAKDYDNDIKISINKLEASGSTIIADLYVYEYYAVDTSSENENINELENAIANKNHVGAKNIIQNKLYGKISHKEIQFKINKRGKFFKYTILYVDNLDN
jgi:hypothetical protein